MHLVEAFVPAVAETMEADWAALVAAHPGLPGQPFVLVATRDGRTSRSARSPQLEPLVYHDPPGEPWYLAAGAGRVRRCVELHCLPDGWGRLAVETGHRAELAETDVAVLTTLANLVVTAVESSHLLAESERLRNAATRAYREASDHAAGLAEANRQLRHARSLLLAMREKELIQGERERLARELHDSVTQRVLAIGMTLEVCRGTPDGGPLRERLRYAQDLARETVATIRDTIFELSATEQALPGGLAPSIRALAAQLSPDGPRVSVVDVGAPVRLPLAIERALLTVTREALFNVVLHSNGTRADVRVAYCADSVELTVSDDGCGDPAELSEHLHEALRSRGGYHRGLSFMHGRVCELGGSLSFSGAGAGDRGVRLTVRVPVETSPGCHVAG